MVICLAVQSNAKTFGAMNNAIAVILAISLSFEFIFVPLFMVFVIQIASSQ